MSTDTKSYDVQAIRSDFPIFDNVTPHGKPLIYLDNAATNQKPRAVIDAITHYYTHQNSNVHRGIHHLSQVATIHYDATRDKVREFYNAPLAKEIVFTSGNTEAINLVAHSFSKEFLNEGDEVLISGMEHHSNIVPWQMACERTGATLKIAPINKNGEIILEEYEAHLSEKTKFVGLVYVSNALGTINPVKQMTKMAHNVGAVVMLDSAQAAPHLKIDVQDIDCDFLSISPHKMCGPTGIGALYGKTELLEKMPPYKGGGDMILSVTFEETIYNEAPFKFEAGTPNIAGVIGLGAAIDYLMDIGMDNIAAHEAQLLGYGTEALATVDGLRMIGTAQHKAGVLGFVMDAAHPHDIGQILDGEGIAIRAGLHCAQPVMKFFGVPATARASVSLYNTIEDIDALVIALRKVNEMFT
jgi:cysteine desulfurase / selenocysteine lyase